MTPTVSRPSANTVQGYIDETPLWRDGTVASASPMTGMQKRIWWLAVAGKFFEGLVVFMTGVALPLIGKEFNLTSAQHGLVSAASLFGILVGALALGSLSDRFGRKPMFVAEMIIFVAFLVALCFASSYVQVVIFLFGLGLALGCDYPTAHMIISENIPSSARGKLVLGAFAFQAIGALAGTAVEGVVAEVVGGIRTQVLNNLPDFAAAQAAVERQNRIRRIGESEIYQYARDRKFEETAIALSIMCDTPIDVVERALLDPGAEIILILAKVAGLSTTTTKAVLLLRAADRGMSAKDLEHALTSFNRLQPETARRVLSFFRTRVKKPAEPMVAPAVAVNG